jgi:hypothetical protein
MSTELIPYSFNTEMIPQSEGQDLPGQYQGVHFTLMDAASMQMILAKIELWFENRDEVILVDHGTTKRGLGFILMEWEECEIDDLFLAILTHEELVEDFSVYTRDMEV